MLRLRCLGRSAIQFEAYAALATGDLSRGGPSPAQATAHRAPPGIRRGVRISHAGHRARAAGHPAAAVKMLDTSSTRPARTATAPCSVWLSDLPLTFLTGFFGMDFGVLVNHLNSTWAFVVAGLLLPAASVAITLLLYRRLLRRFGVGNLTRPGSHA